MRLVVPFAILAALLAGVVLLDGGSSRGDLTVGFRADVFTLDPQRMSYTQDLMVASALYEGLVALDPDDCSLRPGVAERWDRLPDGVTYRFHLRPGARWSNGDPVRAADFVHAWRRAMLPDTAADYSGMFFHIDGAEDLFRWRADRLASFPQAGETAASLWQDTLKRFDDTVGLRAIDDRTLEVRLRRPVAYFLDLLTFPVFSPVHEPTIRRYTRLEPATGAVREDAAWTRPGTLVSNGPYRLASWRYKRDMRLERNPHHWNPDAVRSDSVVILPIEDANTAVLAFEGGAVDWIHDVGADYRADMLDQRRTYIERYGAELDRARAQGLSTDEAVAQLPPPDPARGERRDIRALNAFGTDFYSFNCRPTLSDGRPNPFADPRVRRAFALAVDKETLVGSVTRLNERVSGSLVPPGSIPGYEPPKGLPFDPNRARAELAGAGWLDRDQDGFLEQPDGTRFPTVDLLYSTGSPRYRDLSLALRDMWRRQLGVEVELRAKEGRFYKDDLRNGNFMIARGGWYGDYGDPTTFLDLSRTADGNNDRGYSSPVYDGMLDAAERETDPERRLALLADAERLLVEEELPILPLCTYVTIYMYDPVRVMGLTEHPRLEQRLGRIGVVGSADGR
ncbi:MAG: peptide ABC transporter substrate-binding protein [Phycisphaerales bacterium]|nr:peptide ABC transporter substrate-binding protein [Phycisphaerales bacterium]